MLYPFWDSRVWFKSNSSSTHLHSHWVKFNVELLVSPHEHPASQTLSSVLPSTVSSPQTYCILELLKVLSSCNAFSIQENVSLYNYLMLKFMWSSRTTQVILVLQKLCMRLYVSFEYEYQCSGNFRWKEWKSESELEKSLTQIMTCGSLLPSSVSSVLFQPLMRPQMVINATSKKQQTDTKTELNASQWISPLLLWSQKHDFYRNV